MGSKRTGVSTQLQMLALKHLDDTSNNPNFISTAALTTKKFPRLAFE
jgi:hypothetical protein